MDTYPYRAYIENLFFYGSDVKTNQLKAGELWYPDAAGKFEDLTHANVKARNDVVTRSRPVELWGRLHLDLVMQEKYLPICEMLQQPMVGKLKDTMTMHDTNNFGCKIDPSQEYHDLCLWTSPMFDSRLWLRWGSAVIYEIIQEWDSLLWSGQKRKEDLTDMSPREAVEAYKN